MKKNFTESSLAISYIQQMLYETYNDNIAVTGEYYKHFDMNYGFAHFIAKYLDYKYPVLDKATRDAYAELYQYGQNAAPIVRPITDVISITNYFLCGNDSSRLRYGYSDTDGDVGQFDDNTDEVIRYNEITLSSDDDYKLYRQIYNRYMTPTWHINAQNTAEFYPDKKGQYMVMNDLPLFITAEKDQSQYHPHGPYTYQLNENTIFTLDKWNIQKNICEIDDFVASYLLGRTITPNSSMEDIYYVQKLMIRNRTLMEKEKGTWCLAGYEDTEFDLTQVIINYQKSHVNPFSTTPLFVTGYFDIFTEAAVLKEVGEDTYAVLGL